MGVYFDIITYAAGLLLAIVILLFLAYTVAVLRAEYQCRGIPNPPGKSFFIGHGITGSKELKDKLGLSNMTVFYYWEQFCGPVFYVRILWITLFAVCDANLTKEIMLNSRHTKPQEAYKTFQKLFGARFLGHGILAEVDHDKWFQRRAIVNPAFRKKYLMGMIDCFNQGADALCQYLRDMADGKTKVEMLDVFNRVTLDVIAKTAFNFDAGALEKGTNCPFPTTLTKVLHGMQKVMENPLLERDPRKSARTLRQEVRDGIALIRGTADDVIRERIRARKRGDYVPSDILNIILDGVNDLDEENVMCMEDLIDEFVTFFIAGQETTSNLLAFTLIQLGRYPDVAKRLQAEVEEVLGSKPDIHFEDLAKLDYMMRVFKETLRLYGPVGGANRLTAFPIKYKDFTIPKGSMVMPVHGVMCRMEEYFDDPLLFNPDRFINDGKVPRHLYAYFPFSLGQRPCIGQQFALIEARVILSKLLQRFEFHLDQSQYMGAIDELTAKPKDKCKNFITLRN